VDSESARIFTCRVTDDDGTRLDVYLSHQLPELSRARIQAIIREGFVTINGRSSKPSHQLKAGDRIAAIIPPMPQWELRAEPVPFGIIYEDPFVIIVNKPPGLVVHPAPGHSSGTLVHGLLEHCRDLSSAGESTRPGIVHRLDKDTSGIIVVAKNDPSHEFLVEQFKSGLVKKEYLAVAHGKFSGESGKIESPIGRHPKRRKEMAVVQSGGRRAFTKWRKLEEFTAGFTFLSVSIHTGRTHQIRVHLSNIGHPVAGDPVYGYGRRWWKNKSIYKRGRIPMPERQMLHAKRLGFMHPASRKYVEFEAPMAEDMERLIQALRAL
jgi:23S rRNA pseudouridine1911/1915/1917 synthase